MGRPRQYGTRRRTVAATAGVIFGSEPSPAPSTAQAVSRKTRSQPLEDWRSVAQTLDEVAQEPPPQQSEPDESDNSSESEECQESELESIEETDNDLEEEDEERVDVISDTDSCVAETSKPLHSDSILSDSEHSSISHCNLPNRCGYYPGQNANFETAYYGEPAPEHLSALADAYKIDRGTDLIISKWSEVIPPTAAIFKIAEASFAEVYRINTKDGTSIIKVLQLKVPTDPACSEISTAIDATDLVAEIRIMNILAEVPGFVGFKDAHLMQGRWAPALHAAYTEFLSEDIDGHEEAYEEEEGDGGEDEGEEPKSYFPDPEIFTDESTFLVLELADAGTVLEECEVTTIDQVWDLLLGVIMALSRAEAMCEFEVCHPCYPPLKFQPLTASQHRDLHENNICVRQKHHIPSHDPISDGDVKYGFSGYVVTIIDYGLSRARVENGDIVFQDLEKDLELFHGESGGMHGMQFDNYRRYVLPLLSQLPNTTHCQSMYQTK